MNQISDFSQLIETLSIPSNQRDEEKIITIINYFEEEGTLELLKKAKVKEIDSNLLNDCFARHMQIQKLEKDEILFRLNDPGDRFYIILKGNIRIFIPDKIKKQITQFEYFQSLQSQFLLQDTALIKHSLSANYEKINFNNYEDFCDYFKLTQKKKFANLLIPITDNLQELFGFYYKNKDILKIFDFCSKFDDINFLTGKTLEIIEEKYNEYKKENIFLYEEKIQANKRRKSVIEIEQEKKQREELEAIEKEKFMKENRLKICLEQKEIILKRFELTDYEKNLDKKYAFMEDNNTKIEFNFYEYLELPTISTKQFFGDLALDSAKNLRKATIKALDMCILGYITRDIYNQYILKNKQVQLAEESVYLHKLSFLKHITLTYFRKKFFKYFSNNIYLKTDVLIQQSEQNNNIFILSSGVVEISTFCSIKDIYELMKEILQKALMINLIDVKDFKNYSEEYLLNFSLNDLPDDHIKKLNEKKLINLFSNNSGETIGLESLLLDIVSPYKVSVYSDSAKIFSIDRGDFLHIVKYRKECKKDYVSLTLNKIKSLLNRLETIKSGNFKKITGKSVVSPLHTVEIGNFVVKTLKEYKNRPKENDVENFLQTPNQHVIEQNDIEHDENLLSIRRNIEIRNMKEMSYDNDIDHNENKILRMKKKDELKSRRISCEFFNPYNCKNSEFQANQSEAIENNLHENVNISPLKHQKNNISKFRRNTVGGQISGENLLNNYYKTSNNIVSGNSNNNYNNKIPRLSDINEILEENVNDIFNSDFQQVNNNLKSKLENRINDNYVSEESFSENTCSDSDSEKTFENMNNDADIKISPSKKITFFTSELDNKEIQKNKNDMAPIHFNQVVIQKGHDIEQLKSYYDNKKIKEMIYEKNKDQILSDNAKDEFINVSPNIKSKLKVTLNQNSNQDHQEDNKQIVNLRKRNSLSYNDWRKLQKFRSMKKIKNVKITADDNSNFNNNNNDINSQNNFYIKDPLNSSLDEKKSIKCTSPASINKNINFNVSLSRDSNKSNHTGFLNCEPKNLIDARDINFNIKNTLKRFSSSQTNGFYLHKNGSIQSMKSLIKLNEDNDKLETNIPTRLPKIGEKKPFSGFSERLLNINNINLNTKIKIGKLSAIHQDFDNQQDSREKLELKAKKIRTSFNLKNLNVLK